jgi:hypothetical protein
VASVFNSSDVVAVEKGLLDQAAVVLGALDVSSTSESVIIPQSSARITAQICQQCTAFPFKCIHAASLTLPAQVVMDLDDICVDTPIAARLCADFEQQLLPRD